MVEDYEPPSSQVQPNVYPSGTTGPVASPPPETTEPTTTPASTQQEPAASGAIIPSTQQAATETMLISYNADQLVLLQQENELLLAQQTLLEELKAEGFSAMNYKEFPGWTSTGRKIILHTSESTNAIETINRRSPRINFPFVIRNIWHNGCTTAGGRSFLKLGYSTNNAADTDIPGENAVSFFINYGTHNAIFIPSGVALTLKPNWLIPDPYMYIHSIQGNGTPVLNFMSLVITIEEFVKDENTLNIA